MRTISKIDNTIQIVPITVVIPCYNCEDTIERALQSVEAQSFKPQEIVVVNDGSHYPSCENIRRICCSYRDPSIKYIFVNLDENRGPGFARNAGWDMSSCDYVAFLDSDDSWHPRKLEIQYGFMKNRPDIAMTGHQSHVINPDLNIASIELPQHWDAQPVTGITQLLSNRFPTRSVMIKNNIPFRFNTNRGHSEDYELWMEIVLSKFPSWRLEIPLAYAFKAQYGVSGLSARLWQMEKKEIASYFEMCRKRLMPSFIFIALLPFSFVKYLKRVAISNLRD